MVGTWIKLRDMPSGQGLYAVPCNSAGNEIKTSVHKYKNSPNLMTLQVSITKAKLNLHINHWYLMAF